jgi:hypothetical protein
MPALFANNASGPLAASVGAAATTITLSSGYGAAFPAPDSAKGEYFFATLVNPSNLMEIVKCTQRINDSFVVQRAQEGTTARTYDVGDKLELRITAGGMASKMDLDGGVIYGPFKAYGNVSLGDSALDVITLRVGSIVNELPLAVTGTGAIDFQNPVTVNGSALLTVASTNILSNKTIDTGQGNIIRLSGNVLTAPSGSATLTFPNSTDVMVGRATTDTLTNKTLVGLAAGSTIFNITGGVQVAIGYRDVPQNRQDGNYAIGLKDAGGHIYSKNAGQQGITIPAYALVPLPIGMAVTIINNGSNDLIVGSGGPILIHANSSLTGNKTLIPKSVITALHVENDVWFLI